MAARFGDFKNWLSRPDQPQLAAEEEPEAKEALPVPQLKIAEGSDVREGAIRASLPKPVERPLGSYTPGGTYIPLSGGMRGWYENSAVPASEARNHYRYDQAVETGAFKKTILERIESFNRRAAERYKVDLWAKHSEPQTANGQPVVRAFCTDLSVRGACLRVRRQFAIGTPISVSLFRRKSDADASQALTTVQALVRNHRPAGGGAESPRYYIGIEFQDISIASKEAIAGLLAGATAIVVRT